MQIRTRRGILAYQSCPALDEAKPGARQVHLSSLQNSVPSVSGGTLLFLPDLASVPHPEPALSESRHRHAARRVGTLAVLGCLAASAMSMMACQKTVLRPDDVRSPYDRYERSRAERAEPYLQDEYGRRTPNLRGRLLQPAE